jgi:MscS family membrane protein
MQGLRRYRCWAMLLSVLLWSILGLSQLPAMPGGSLPSPVSQPKDPLGRETPQSAILRFVRAAHRGDYATAARYLELPTLSERREGPELARKLLTLMDTSLVGSVATLSQSPTGFLDDSADPNVEVVGRLVVQDKDVPFVLVRVTEKDVGPIWLVSWQTLEQVPALFELAGAPVLDQYIPAFLADHSLLGISAGRWIAWVLSIPLSLALGGAMVWLIRKLYLIMNPGSGLRWHGVGKPSAMILATLVHAFIVFLIGIPLFYRVYYFRSLAVLLMLCVTWFAVGLLNRAHDGYAIRVGGKEAQSFLQLGYQLLKVGLVIGAALCILAILGFDTKTVLAGLGIGGIAIALAAQKTLENLLGGITLVTDNAIYIGDDCIISGRYVTVRNIGLRSTSATTREGTDIWFPNGVLVQSNIENLSRRSKFLIFTTLSLSSQCSLEQVQCVIVKVREMLYSHTRVEQDSARFRLAGIRGPAYEIELFAYVRSSNGSEFAAIQEDIFLRIATIAELAGAAWAVSAQVNFPSTKTLVNQEKAAQAEQTVQGWRDGNQNPFPDFTSARIAEMRGTLPYPSNGTTSADRTSSKSQYKGGF